MPLQDCRVCGERKFLERSGVCLSERCSPREMPPGESVVSEPVVQLIEGEACPTCGQSVAKSGKTRQREYRERKRG